MKISDRISSGHRRTGARSDLCTALHPYISLRYNSTRASTSLMRVISWSMSAMFVPACVITRRISFASRRFGAKCIPSVFSHGEFGKLGIVMDKFIVVEEGVILEGSAMRKWATSRCIKSLQTHQLRTSTTQHCINIERDRIVGMIDHAKMNCRIWVTWTNLCRNLSCEFILKFNSMPSI